jgi:hypothetical protein
MPGTPKRLVHLCQQCGTGLPLIRTKAAIDVVSRIAQAIDHHRRFT